MFPFPECITLLAVGLAESVAIVTLNTISIIVFIKNRNLRKRSMYLVINLAVADLLVAGIAIHGLFYLVGGHCNLWKSPKNSVYVFVDYFITFASLSNITMIALERFYATFWPFRCRVMRKSVYGFIIASVWVVAGLLLIILGVLIRLNLTPLYLWFPYCSVCLLIICISYTCIVIKVRCGAQPQHHGAASRERKLTMTLLIVTVVSLALYLPDNIYHLLYDVTGIISSLSKVTSTRLHNALNVLYYANSLVNPLLYAIRMPEYRSALLALFRRRPQQLRRNAVLPLHDM